MLNTENLLVIQNSKYEVSFLGRLLWFTVPELKIKYQELLQSLANNSLGLNFLPKPISARDAFRRATKTAEKKQLDLPNNQKLNLLVREVFNDKEIIIRQIVREIVDAQNIRLSYTPIVELKYDNNFIDDRRLESFLYPEEEFAVETVLNEFEDNKECYNSQHIRTLILEILSECKSVAVRPSGGVYFTPEKYATSVQNLKNWISGLSSYCINNDHPSFYTVPVIDVNEQREMVHQSLQDQVKAESQTLINEITEIVKTSRKVSPNTAQKYVEQVKTLKVKVKEYEDILETEIITVQETMQLALDAARKLLDNAIINN